MNIVYDNNLDIDLQACHNFCETKRKPSCTHFNWWGKSNVSFRSNGNIRILYKKAKLIMWNMFSP